VGTLAVIALTATLSGVVAALSLVALTGLTLIALIVCHDISFWRRASADRSHAVPAALMSCHH
jgi:hypothetical protein